MKLFDEKKDPQKPEVSDKNTEISGKSEINKDKLGNNKLFLGGKRLGVVLAFFIIGTLFIFVENRKEIEEISIPQLAQDVIAGDVIKITIEEEKLEIEYAMKKSVDNKEPIIKRSKKESEVSLTETLADYGVKQEQLVGVNIDTKNSSSLKHLLVFLVPFLIPALLVVGFFRFFFMVSLQTS